MCSPKESGDFKYDELVTLLDNVLKPRSHILLARQKFFERTQKPTESASEFFLGLKELAAGCGYRDEAFNEMVRDKFISGLKDPGLREAVLKVDGKTAEDVLKEPQMYEIVHKPPQSSFNKFSGK